VPAARADLTPPPRASITLELTVDNQAAFPGLKFVVTNCGPGESPSVAVLDRDTAMTCHPAQGPLRIFGVGSEDVPRFFDLQRPGVGRDEAAAFMAAKMKTCGSVEDQDLVFEAKTGVVFVAARYALDPGPKDGCKLRRVSATTKTEVATPAKASASASAPAAPSAATPTVPPPSQSGCGCATSAPRGPSPIVLLLAPALFWWRRRRRAPRGGFR